MAERIRKPGDHFALAEAGKVQSNAQVTEHAGTELESLTPPATSSMSQSYAIVLDRSTAARILVQRIDQQSDSMVNIRAQTVEFWQQSDHPYLVLWWMLDGTDKLTLTPADMTALLSDALPTIIQRVKMAARICTFLIGTETADSKLIEERLTRLQSVAE